MDMNTEGVGWREWLNREYGGGAKKSGTREPGKGVVTDVKGRESFVDKEINQAKWSRDAV